MTNTLKDAVRNFMDKQANSLIEANPEDYFIKTESYGSFNNGVGFASCGDEDVYDTCRAQDEVEGNLLESLNALTGKKGCYLDEELLEAFLSVPEVNELLKMVVLGKVNIVQKECAKPTNQLAEEYFTNLFGNQFFKGAKDA